MVEGRGKIAGLRTKIIKPVRISDVWMRGEGLDGRTNMSEQKMMEGGSGGSSNLR